MQVTVTCCNCLKVFSAAVHFAGPSPEAADTPRTGGICDECGTLFYFEDRTFTRVRALTAEEITRVPERVKRASEWRMRLYELNQRERAHHTQGPRL